MTPDDAFPAPAFPGARGDADGRAGSPGVPDAAGAPAASAGTPPDAEEYARAEVYGLLARLFHAPPDAALHDGLRAAATPSSGGAAASLEASWAGLVAAARRVPLAAARDEYATLFLGIGKPEVFLYGSYHVAGHLNQKPLVDLRHDLRGLGLERPPDVVETEDHVACLCDAMRWLVVGDGRGGDDLATQRRIFERHLRAWAGSLCDAIAAHPAADFYAAVAVFARDFFAVEAQAFDLLDA